MNPDSNGDEKPQPVSAEQNTRFSQADSDTLSSVDTESMREKDHSRLQQARETLQETAGRARELGRKAAEHAPIIAHRTEDLVLQSREMRLATEATNKRRNVFQRFFSKGAGKVVKTGLEMIPFPGTAYGPGDVITLLSAVRGKDTLSGESLDAVDRVIHVAAAVIPVVPATPFVEVARKIRHGVEEAAYARKQGDLKQAAEHVQGIVQTGKDAQQSIKDSRSKPHNPPKNS